MTPYTRTPDLVSPASESDSASPLMHRLDPETSPSSSRPGVHSRKQILASRAYGAHEQYEREIDTEAMELYVDPAVPAIGQASTANLLDWLTSEHRRSAHFIAEKACEMICYLWFSNNVVPGQSSPKRANVDQTMCREKTSKSRKCAQISALKTKNKPKTRAKNHTWNCFTRPRFLEGEQFHYGSAMCSRIFIEISAALRKIARKSH